jgi:hypothetical protein
MPRPQHLPPSKPIEHLFFYKIFLCLVYADQTWYLYDTPDEAFGGCVGKKGGKEEALSVADRICKNMEERADRNREQPASPLYFVK